MLIFARFTCGSIYVCYSLIWLYVTKRVANEKQAGSLTALGICDLIGGFVGIMLSISGSLLLSIGTATTFVHEYNLGCVIVMILLASLTIVFACFFDETASNGAERNPSSSDGAQVLQMDYVYILVLILLSFCASVGPEMYGKEIFEPYLHNVFELTYTEVTLPYYEKSCEIP